MVINRERHVNPFAKVVVDPATIGIVRDDFITATNKHQVVVTIRIQQKLISSVCTPGFIAAFA